MRFWSATIYTFVFWLTLLKLTALARRFAAFSRQDQLALIPATLRLLLVRFMLRTFPFRRVLLWAERSEWRGAVPRSVDTQTERRIRAVERAGHLLFPRNPCLTEAVLVHRLLRRRGHPSALRIGVRKGSGPLLEAHAWIECYGDVVIGSRGLSHEHTPLPPIELATTRRMDEKETPADGG